MQGTNRMATRSRFCVPSCSTGFLWPSTSAEILITVTARRVRPRPICSILDDVRPRFLLFGYFTRSDVVYLCVEGGKVPVDRLWPAEALLLNLWELQQHANSELRRSVFIFFAKGVFNPIRSCVLRHHINSTVGDGTPHTLPKLNGEDCATTKWRLLRHCPDIC